MTFDNKALARQLLKGVENLEREIENLENEKAGFQEILRMSQERIRLLERIERLSRDVQTTANKMGSVSYVNPQGMGKKYMESLITEMAASLLRLDEFDRIHREPLFKWDLITRKRWEAVGGFEKSAH